MDVDEPTPVPASPSPPKAAKTEVSVLALTVVALLLSAARSPSCFALPHSACAASPRVCAESLRHHFDPLAIADDLGGSRRVHPRPRAGLTDARAADPKHRLPGGVGALAEPVCAGAQQLMQTCGTHPGFHDVVNAHLQTYFGRGSRGGGRPGVGRGVAAAAGMVQAAVPLPRHRADDARGFAATGRVRRWVQEERATCGDREWKRR